MSLDRLLGTWSFEMRHAELDDHHCHYFDTRGVTRVYGLVVDGTAWTMIRRDDDFWQRSAAAFTGLDAMEGTGENSFDQGATWQHDYAITYPRLG